MLYQFHFYKNNCRGLTDLISNNTKINVAYLSQFQEEYFYSCKPVVGPCTWIIYIIFSCIIQNKTVNIIIIIYIRLFIR